MKMGEVKNVGQHQVKIQQKIVVVPKTKKYVQAVTAASGMVPSTIPGTMVPGTILYEYDTTK